VYGRKEKNGRIAAIGLKFSIYTSREGKENACVCGDILQKCTYRLV
jgi:hypothetical protein